MKELILKSEEELIFMYTSQSSLRTGNFTIDNRYIIHDVYSYIVKIYDLISKYRCNKFKLIIFDTIKKDDKSLFNGKNVTLYQLNKCKYWYYMFDQMDQYLNNFI